MYFPDLSPYVYTPPEEGANVQQGGHYLNVGWIEAGHNYATGNVSHDVSDIILALCSKPISMYGGYQACSLCYGFDYELQPPICSVVQNQQIITLGNGEIEVPGTGDKIYRAPTLIYHYIVNHQYNPPQEFIEAILNLDKRK